jgi:hypothetical protein
MIYKKQHWKLKIEQYSGLLYHDILQIW